MTENRHNQPSSNPHRHPQTLGNLVVPGIDPLADSITETPYDIMQASGLSKAKSNRINEELFLRNEVLLEDTAMDVDGVEYPYLHNLSLPNPGVSKGSRWLDIVNYNNTQINYGFIQHGFVVTGGDNHFARDPSGTKMTKKLMAIYRHPGLSAEGIDNFLTHLLPNMGMTYDNLDKVLVASTAVGDAIDLLIEQPGYEKFRNVADKHREKAKERAKAKPYGQFR